MMRQFQQLYSNKIVTPLYMQKEKKNEVIDDGFSSEEQFRHEEILVDKSKKQDLQKLDREQVKFKIPPPQQIKNKTYSLKPDIATGWSKKEQGPVPIPLFFQQRRVDMLVKRLLDEKNQLPEKMRLCYLGPRFQSTFYAWYDQQFEFPYSDFKAPKNMKFTDRDFCGQHWDAEDNLVFDSIFEAGNLDCAIQVDENEYDLYLRVDSNTRGHLNWYNFKIKNLQKLKKYRLNICNLQKTKTLYNRGMKPYIFSRKAYERTKKKWQQGGDSLKYEQKFSKSMKILNLDYCCSCKLSFQIYTEYNDDTIQIAYCVPYTYTELNEFLTSLQQNIAHRNICTFGKLCTSLGGIQIPLLTITDNDIKSHFKEDIQRQQQNGKKCLIACGRVHPGESNGSHMIQGFIQYLCGSSKEAKILRKEFVFKIVPMLNPDGVCLGNYRTGISGKDFNREYRDPDKVLFPQIYSFKRLAFDLKAEFKQNLIMFLDFHGHSTKKNVFMYGPEYPIIKKEYYESRIFPKIIGDLTNMFRYYSCSFKISYEKRSTARAIFLRALSIPFSYTIQGSNGSFYDSNNLKDYTFKADSWVSMGKMIGKGVGEYGDLILSAQRQRCLKKKQRQSKLKKKNKMNSKIKSDEEMRLKAKSIGGQQANYLFDSTNSKIKKIFEEIQALELRREEQRNEEDQISEGSSDGEGEKDDLPASNLNFLYQTIKNKKSNRIKNKNLSYESCSFQESTCIEKDPDSCSPELQDFNMKKQELETKTKKNNHRIHWLRNRNKDEKKEIQMSKNVEAPNIINFNFLCLARPSINPNYRKKLSLSAAKTMHLYANTSTSLFLVAEKQKTNLKKISELNYVENEVKVLDLSTVLPRTQRTQSMGSENRKIYSPAITKPNSYCRLLGQHH